MEMGVSNYGILVLILCSVSHLCNCATNYKTCGDVSNALGSAAKDGEYIINVNSRVAVSFYCSGKIKGYQLNLNQRIQFTFFLTFKKN